MKKAIIYDNEDNQFEYAVWLLYYIIKKRE